MAMPELTDEHRSRFPLKSFLADFRSNLTDQELKHRYKLSTQALVVLIRDLVAKGVISVGDLARRKEMAVQRDLARESEFLAGLFICPNCSHPSPEPFETCPACGARPDDFLPGEELLDSLATTGGHINVEVSDEEVEVVEELDVANESPQRPYEQGAVSTRDTETETKEKSSPLKAVRSFFSQKMKKK
jgi:hypothetical protein